MQFPGNGAIVDILGHQREIIGDADINRIEKAVTPDFEQLLFKRRGGSRRNCGNDLQLAADRVNGRTDQGSRLAEVVGRNFLTEVLSVSIADRRQRLVACRLQRSRHPRNSSMLERGTTTLTNRAFSVSSTLIW